LNSFAFFFLSQEAPCWIPTEIFPEAERARVELKVTGERMGLQWQEDLTPPRRCERQRKVGGVKKERKA
jgi:hypothetical protein